MRKLLVVLLVFIPGMAWSQDPGTEKQGVEGAIKRGLEFLVKDAEAWKKEHNCASCHHAALVVWSFQEAKQHRRSVDETTLAELTKWLAESGNGKFNLERPKEAPHAASPKAIYFSLALGLDPQRNEASRAGMKLLLSTVMSEQTANGSWSTWPNTRPPIFGPSDESLTALAVLALLPEADSGDESAIKARDKGIQWLSETPSDDDPQSIALRLILWSKLGRPTEEMQPLIERIKKRQKDDGGWSQSHDMPSDAWGTGQAIYALVSAGVESSDTTVKRGREFLIMSQRDDGSWKMESRPTPPSGKGGEYLVPITGAGSAWGVLGLIKSSDDSSPPSQTDAPKR